MFQLSMILDLVPSQQRPTHEILENNSMHSLHFLFYMSTHRKPFTITFTLSKSRIFCKTGGLSILTPEGSTTEI